MKKTLTVKAKRDDMLVGTLESDSPLFKAFPAGSVVIVKPSGADARSDMELGTLRKEWAEARKTKAAPVKAAPAEAVEIDVNPLGTIGTLKERMAEALGLPAEAISLRLPDKTVPNPQMRIASFYDRWGATG